MANQMLRYSSSASFPGMINTGIPQQQWAEMTDSDRDSVVAGLLTQLVDVWED